MFNQSKPIHNTSYHKNLLCYCSNSFCIKVWSAVSVVHQFSELRLRLYAISVFCLLHPFLVKVVWSKLSIWSYRQSYGQYLQMWKVSIWFFFQGVTVPVISTESMLSLLLCQLAIRVSSLSTFLYYESCVPWLG